MSNVCCKEFTGWLKSFTKIERALTVLEAILLVVLITLVILLILHLIVCSKSERWAEDIPSTGSTTKATATIIVDGQKSTVNDTCFPKIIPETISETVLFTTNKSVTYGPTNKSEIKCSWTPSAKTTAGVHYYEDGHTSNTNPKLKDYVPNLADAEVQETGHLTTLPPEGSMESIARGTGLDLTTDSSAKPATFENIQDIIRSDLSDGEEADQEYEKHVVALVKLKPPKDIIFGCILTIVAEFWALTAASCIEAVEETDSLDSFVIMPHYGTDGKGPLQAVDDVRVHPLYAEKRTSYDLAALRSAGSLAGAARAPVRLASFLDVALAPLADEFVILGYGPFRSIEGGAAARRLRQLRVHKLAARACGAARGAGALRHLERGRARARPACGGGALCAGVLYSRGLPCNACAGAPLLARGAARGLLAAPAPCGDACEPALYVSLPDPDVADWIHATLHDRTLY